MGQMLFSDFYTLCKDAVDARKSNSKSPHINKVEKECREKWNNYTHGESKVLGFSNGAKMYTDNSVRAAYTAFFLDLCKKDIYVNIFNEKGYFYSPNDLVGDKEWDKDFVQVKEGKFFHADCQVFVFLLKAVRAIIDLGEESLLKECSIVYGSLPSDVSDDETVDDGYTENDANLHNADTSFDVLELEMMMKNGEDILFRVEKDAIKYCIDKMKNGENIDAECLNRVRLANRKLEKWKKQI